MSGGVPGTSKGLYEKEDNERVANTRIGMEIGRTRGL